jgi:hypothetical protein
MIIQEWMEELIDHDVIALVNQDGNEDDEDNCTGTGLGLVKTERLSHSERRHWLTLNNNGSNCH